MRAKSRQRGATSLTRLATAATLMVVVLFGTDPAPASAAPPGQSPGIDISSYQHPGDKPIDWAAVKSSGMRFVYIKATEPTRTGRSYVNPWFQRDWAGAGAVGLYRGAYHFAQPRLPLGTAEQDAQQFLNVTGGMSGPLDMPPVLDLEATGGLSPTNLTNWTARWLAYVQKVTGKKPIIYSGWAFWKTSLNDTTQFNGHQLWMARWQTSGPSPLPGGWSSWKIWQYGTTKVPGIKNAVDANVMCGTVPTTGAPAGCPGVPSSSSTKKSSASTAKGTTTKTTSAKTTTAKGTTSKPTVAFNGTPIVSKKPATGRAGKPVYYYTYKGVRYSDPSSPGYVAGQTPKVLSSSRR